MANAEKGKGLADKIKGAAAGLLTKERIDQLSHTAGEKVKKLLGRKEQQRPEGRVSAPSVP